MGTRMVTEDVYAERRALYRAQGRRQMIAVLMLSLLVLALVGLGLGVVASQGAQVPIAGGGRVTTGSHPASKLMQRVFDANIGHHVRGLIQNCRGNICAVYTVGKSSYEGKIVKLPDGSYRVAIVLIPDSQVLR